MTGLEAKSFSSGLRQTERITIYYMDTPALTKIAARLRFLILKMTDPVKSGHPTTCFSAIELMTMLFFRHLKYDLDNPANPANDRVIFSKGHASALLYALYAIAGKVSPEELATYRHFQSPLEGHPTFRFPFAEAATGSLGQGLSVAAGEAWAIRGKFKSHIPTVKSDDRFGIENVPKTEPEIHKSTYDATIVVPFSVPRVFCLMGDGETAEGSVWEAAAWAAHINLNNLIAVVDVNRFGQSAETMSGGDTESYRRKFEAFGWGVIVINGHDFGEIDAAFEKAICYKTGPVAIIARTMKGKGISYWEDKDGFHNKMLPPEELARDLKEFGKPENNIKGIIGKPDQNSAVADENLDPSSVSHAESSLSAPSKQSRSQSEAGLNVVSSANSAPNMNNIETVYPVDQPVATKQAFGNALLKLGTINPRMLILDGDVGNSLETNLFAKAFPDRFLQMYIAEQDMAGTAVGLARQGYLPVINTFAAFLTRCHDQLRMMPLSNVKVLVNGSYVGVSVGRDGPSQMGLEDIALFRSVSGSTVLYPSDPYQTEFLAAGVIDHGAGVIYFRTTREPMPVIYGPEDDFSVGGSKVFIMKDPTSSSSAGLRGVNKIKDAVTVVAAGITLHEALKTQNEVFKDGIRIRVIDCYSIKPIDIATLKKAAQETRAIITVEDHYPEGGLGEAVMSALSDTSDTKVYRMAVNKLPMSGTAAELLAYEEIDAAAITAKVRSIINELRA